MTRPRAERPGRVPAYVNAPPRLRASQIERPFVPYLEQQQPKRWWRW
jgi:hypothetical protein